MQKTGLVQTQTPVPTGDVENLRGIAGWLLLPFMHLALNTGRTIQLFAPVADLPAWFKAAMNPDLQDIGPYTPYPYAPRYVLGLSLSYIVLLCLAAVCLLLIRRRSALLRPVISGYYLFSILVAAGTLLVSYRWEEAAARLMGQAAPPPFSILFWPALLLAFAVLWAAVWIPYFWRSRRVANTFNR
jgi:hypothetical protein